MFIQEHSGIPEEKLVALPVELIVGPSKGSPFFVSSNTRR
jgi:hypothetical protein